MIFRRAFVEELDPEKHIVVICHHGVRSMNVTAWLRQQGFAKTCNRLRGGIDRWAREIDPKVPLYCISISLSIWQRVHC